MKKFLKISFIACLIISPFLYWPELGVVTESYTKYAFRKVFYDKKIFFLGLNRLTRQDLEELVPKDSSIFSWLLYSQDIETALLNHPLIATAEVTRCASDFLPKISCFEVLIEERSPQFIVFGKKTAWLLGMDGGFIKQVDAERATKAMLNSKKSRAKAIYGLAVDDVSPDKLKSQIFYVRDATQTLESETGMLIEQVELLEAADLRVRFAGLDTEIRLGGVRNSFAELKSSAGRLTLVISELKRTNSPMPREIDLGFNKIAVMR